MHKIVKNTSSGQRAQQLINPTKDKKYDYRVHRSGDFYDPAVPWMLDGRYVQGHVQASLRKPADDYDRYSDLGFRIVRNVS